MSMVHVSWWLAPGHVVHEFRNTCCMLHAVQEFENSFNLGAGFSCSGSRVYLEASCSVLLHNVWHRHVMRLPCSIHVHLCPYFTCFWFRRYELRQLCMRSKSVLLVGHAMSLHSFDAWNLILLVRLLTCSIVYCHSQMGDDRCLEPFNFCWISSVSVFSVCLRCGSLEHAFEFGIVECTTKNLFCSSCLPYVRRCAATTDLLHVSQAKSEVRQFVSSEVPSLRALSSTVWVLESILFGRGQGGTCLST